MAPTIAYMNGKYIPFEKICVHITDLGFTRGYSVFDLAATVNGVPFMLDEHLERLKKSVQVYGIVIKINKIHIKKVIKNLLQKNKFEESVIRVIVTGGSVISSSVIDNSKPKPNLFIFTEVLKFFPKKYYTNGIHVVSTANSRNNYLVKSINYGSVLALLARNKKAKEILYVHDGKIFEGGTSNFFLFKKNTLITAESGVLKGITRKVVLKLARKKFKVEVRNVHETELKVATESFMTATIKNVMPVVAVDGQKIGNGKVGENTKILMKEYNRFVEKWVEKNK